MSTQTDMSPTTRPPAFAWRDVTGSRSLTGVAALSSSSERIAHAAPCSVLVIRQSPNG